MFKFSQDCQLAMELHRYNPRLLTSLDEQTNMEAITNRLDDRLMEKWLEHRGPGPRELIGNRFAEFAQWIQERAELDLE
jgi:hypothetical protein